VVETLEDRTVPTAPGLSLLDALQGNLPVNGVPPVGTCYWINPAGGDWDDPTNWSTGSVPDQTDRAVIDLGNIRVTHSQSSSDRVMSLYCTADLALTAGTLALTDDSVVESLTLAGGTLRASKDVSIVDHFLWSSGELTGGGEYTVYGRMDLAGAGTLLLDAATLTNAGSAVWTSGRVDTSSSASFQNLAGATFTDVAAAQWTPSFVNNGTVTVAVPGGTASFGTFTNSGALLLQSGTFAAALYTQTAGLTDVDGGVLSSASTVQLLGGSLQGPGTVSAALQNSATVQVSGGTIRVTGDYAQSATGLLDVNAGGRLVAGGTAYLYGSLHVTGAHVGTTTVVEAGEVVGAFANVQVDAPPNTRVQVIYNDANVTIVVTPVVVIIAPDPGSGSNGGSQPGGGSNTGSSSSNQQATGPTKPAETTVTNLPGTTSAFVDASVDQLVRPGQFTATLPYLHMTGDASHDFDALASRPSETARPTNEAVGPKLTFSRPDGTDEIDLLDRLVLLADVDISITDDSAVSGELARAQFTGRVDVLPQRGSAVASVATVATVATLLGDDTAAEAAGTAEVELNHLLMNPLSMLCSPNAPIAPPPPALTAAPQPSTTDLEQKPSLGRLQSLILLPLLGLGAFQVRRWRKRSTTME
jgi:hypothetical protein